MAKEEHPTEARLGVFQKLLPRSVGGVPDGKDNEVIGMRNKVEVFTQNSIRIRGNGKVIYIDPFQMKESPRDADFVLITHDHYDHFSPEDLAKVSGEHTVLVVPEKMAERAEAVSDLVCKIVSVRPGAHYEINGLLFDTVPAYNRVKPFHPKSAGWVGYILEVDGKKVYVAGDTDATKEARQVQCDVALVPIGGTFTMDARRAAELINTIRPAIAIPTHYGTIVGKPEDAEVFAGKVRESIRVERIKQY